MKALPYSRINTLLNLDPTELVRVYSMQCPPSWEKAQQTGYLTGDVDNVESNHDNWSDAYRWMRDRMAARIPDFSGDYPVWAWLKKPSGKPYPKRDGREDTIRITAMIPRGRMLLSDFDDWHSVLNCGFDCDTEAEWDAHTALWPDRPHRGHERFNEYYAVVEPTWHRVFDFTPSDDPDVMYWKGNRNSATVQACIDRIHLTDIVEVRDFNNAGR